MSYEGSTDPFLPPTVQHLRRNLRAVWIEAYNAAETATPGDARAAVRTAWARVNAVQKEQKAGQDKPAKDGKAVTCKIIEEAGKFCVYEDGEKLDCFPDRAGAEAYLKAREDGAGEDAEEKAFDESKHPRGPKGQAIGGQFVEAGGAGAQSEHDFRYGPGTSSPSAMTPEAAKLLDAVRSGGDITGYDDETLGVAYLAVSLGDEPDVARRISEEMRRRQGDASSWAFGGSSPASDAVAIPDDLTKLLKREQVALAGKLAEMPMRKLRALQAKTQKALAEAIGKQREHLDILDRIIISAIDYRSFGQYEAKEALVSFKAFRQPDGRTRWVLTSSGGFEDRDGEVVSTAFLESAVKVADRTKERGPLLIFHVPGSDIGTCDFQAVVGEPGFLLESGLFADTEAGRRASVYYQSHAKETGASIKFLYANRTPDGTYLPPGAILERSLMRRERAAFPWSALSLPEVYEMAKLSQEKRDELETVLGADLAVQIIDQLYASAEALKQAGVRSKAASDEPTDQAAADDTPEPAPKTDDGLIAAKETLSEAGQALADTAQTGGEFEMVLTPEAMAMLTEKATSAVSGQIVALATQLKAALDGLETLSAAVEKNAQVVAALQRTDDAKVAEKVAHLPRATVRMLQAPELYRASQAKEATEPEQDERTDLDRILAVVHGA